MDTQIKNNDSGKKISRKEAIKKAGITALATTSFLLLKTNAQACASCQNNNNGSDD